MGLLNRFERVFGRFAIPNLSLYLVGGQVVFWSVALLGFFDLERLIFAPVLLQVEPWRVFTFMLLPPPASPVFIAFAWYLFYLMGSALEGYWGVFRYNCFLFVGWALTVAVSFIHPQMAVTNLFLFGSVFLAFAFLNPEFELRLFFILPVKIKWLALIQWALYGLTFVTGSWAARLLVLAAVGNFLLFFAGDIIQRIRTGRRQMQQQVRRTAMREAADEARHRCVVCGKTDRTHPQMDFRYCSQCAGEECYCSEHIRDHVHTTAPKQG